MIASQSRIWTPLDFERDGKFVDYLRLPHSTDRSAYGCIQIPIVCIKNAIGPTALLIAGNHGDEYEGQIALMNLARRLTPREISGRVIVLPSANFPAVKAARRVSPVDAGNLNRSFPGSATGTPTEMIAHYISTVLLPMSDIAIDLHSGGLSLDYVRCAIIRPGRTSEEHQELLELLRVFGAPISFVDSSQGGGGGGGATTLNAVARSLGVPTITTELGGGATVSPAGVQLAEHGITRVLKHIGIAPNLAGEERAGTEFMDYAGRDSSIYADADGIFEPAALVGQEVFEGDLAGRLYYIDDPTREPMELRFRKSGRVECRRFPSLTARGDCLYTLMLPTVV
ncbi:succinylglutamate desuccinylase/aspartoacylase family protein [Bradyrhizobium sp. 186]|uniref:succinylglutamate desuccinylase/aspartoacylase family protein n=1 Tax=Bradyrhizobium sp. 186 TaxID=2782654 RepID=UPI0020010E6C|nr:succinylglutamate desuccinylase/aspartoacylase family protein [Bradyrhizobium sp. 186]UPK34518.1 succinylglutamate desuccinylase/aspartoacylase family protein [Bradyrhizobium sp. 186]